MRFNVYGRFQVDVQRQGEAWLLYRSESGKRVKLSDVPIPNDVAEHEVATYLDDIFHEFAEPGRSVVLIEDPHVPNGGIDIDRGEP